MNLKQISVRDVCILEVTERMVLVTFSAFPGRALLADPEPVTTCNNAFKLGNVEGVYFRPVCVGHCHRERLFHLNTDPRGQLVKACREHVITVLYVETAVAFHETLCVIPGVSVEEASCLQSLSLRAVLPIQIYGSLGNPKITQLPLLDVWV